MMNNNNNNHIENFPDTFSYYEKFMSLFKTLLESHSGYELTYHDTSLTYFLNVEDGSGYYYGGFEKLKKDFFSDIVIADRSRHQKKYQFCLSSNEFSALIQPLMKKGMQFQDLMHLCETVGLNQVVFQLLASNIKNIQDLPELFSYPVLYSDNENNARMSFDALAISVQVRLLSSHSNPHPRPKTPDSQDLKEMFIHHIEICPNLKNALNNYVLYSSMKPLLRESDLQDMMTQIYPEHEKKPLLSLAPTQTYALEINYEALAAQTHFESEYAMHRFLKFMVKHCNTEKVLKDVQAKSISLNNEVSKEYAIIYIQAKTEQPVQLAIIHDVLEHALLLTQDNPDLFRDNNSESENMFNKLYTRVRLEHQLPENEQIETKTCKNKL